MKNNNTTSFTMGLLCAFLVLNGIANATRTDQIVWIGIVELLAAGFLSYPHIMNIWNGTGRAVFVAFREGLKSLKDKPSNFYEQEKKSDEVDS